MKRGKRKAIEKEGRLSGQYKLALTGTLIKALKLERLSPVQMRRVFSYAYQSLRKGRKA